MKRSKSSIYSRPGTSLPWCEYWLRNKQHRESTGTSKPEDAQDFLDHRLMELGADVIGALQFISPSRRKVRISKLLDDLEADCILRNKASGPFKFHLKAIRVAFGEWPAVEVTRAAIDRYIIAEREGQAADATINRRLQLLSQAFALAVQNGDLLNLQMPFTRCIGSMLTPPRELLANRGARIAIAPGTKLLNGSMLLSPRQIFKPKQRIGSHCWSGQLQGQTCGTTSCL